MEKKCSIIIPTKDKISRLRIILKALECQVDDSMEVIVVFDGCKKKTIEEFYQLNISFKPVPVILHQNIGRSAARNRGLQVAKGKIIIFLDDDRIPTSHYVRRHIEAHDEECVVLGERKEVFLSEKEIEELYHLKDIHSYTPQLTVKAKRDLYNDIKKIFLKNPYHPFRYMAFITGNVSVDKSILERVGGFDEYFVGWGYEDTDLGYRIAKDNIKYKADFNIVNYHLKHRHLRLQKSREELRNIDYISTKFVKDTAFQRVLKVYRLKAKLLL